MLVKLRVREEMPVLKQMFARDHETQPTASIEDLRRVEILNDSELDTQSASEDFSQHRCRASRRYSIVMGGQRRETCSRQATRQSNSCTLPDT
jgi:hypothetical protein